ncbi:hypothetical protein Scep_007801 [Stephania cephalantha]|uniref:Uncharacterized protein n=1 Tax=Stephania cephalantha TaxID=152367 RepID=A0AAP0KCH9_9MAGN
MGTIKGHAGVENRSHNASILRHDERELTEEDEELAGEGQGDFDVHETLKQKDPRVEVTTTSSGNEAFFINTVLEVIDEIHSIFGQRLSLKLVFKFKATLQSFNSIPSLGVYSNTGQSDLINYSVDRDLALRKGDPRLYSPPTLQINKSIKNE